MTTMEYAMKKAGIEKPKLEAVVLKPQVQPLSIEDWKYTQQLAVKLGVKL